MNACVVRRLTQADLPAFRPVRLTALREHPEAFASSYEEESAYALADFARFIPEVPPGASFGGFAGPALAGPASHGPASHGPASTGQAPAGPAPDRPALAGQTPTGPAPHGPAPDGPILVGIAGLVVSPRLKQRHKGTAVSVYVDPA